MLGLMLWGFLILIVWLGYTQAEVGKKALPIIEIDMPTYDFGRALQGEVVKHEFQVFNRGSAPLEIKNVRPS